MLAVAFEDGEFTGKREEIVCVGESREVLDDPSCEIADPAALHDEYSALSAAFCE